MTEEEYEDRMDILVATERWLKYEDTVMKEEEKQRRLEKIQIRKELLEVVRNLNKKDGNELVLFPE